MIQKQGSRVGPVIIGLATLHFGSHVMPRTLRMTQAETVKLVRSLDTALAVRQQLSKPTQQFNTNMAEVGRPTSGPTT